MSRVFDEKNLPVMERARRSLLNVDWVRASVLGGTLIILLLFIAYPLFTMLGLSLVPRGAELEIGNFSLRNFERLWTGLLFRQAIINSLKLCTYVVITSTIIGVTYAYFMARVKLYVSKTLMMTLGTIPLLMPPFVGSYSWVVLFGRAGALTRVIETYTPFSLPTIFGMGGMVIAMTATMWPFVFLLSYGALALNDPSLEESADVMGASPLRKLLTVTLPLATPGILTGAIIVFMRALGNFGTPAILGRDTYVIPTLIYFRIVGYMDFHGAAAMALVSVAIVVLCLAIIRFYVKKRDYTSMTSRVQGAKQSQKPWMRTVGTIVCLAIVAFSLLPQATVVMGAFGETWRGTLFPTQFGFGHFARIFSREASAIQNSLFLATTATAIALVVGTILAYISVRKQSGKQQRGGVIIDITVMLPFILPGIVVGVAIAAAFGSGPLVLTGTGTILLVAYVVRRMPYNFRSAASALSSLDGAMEEASAVNGASWSQTARKIIVPLIIPGVIAGAVLSFISLVGELSATVILYSGGWKTMSIAIYEYLIGHEPGPAFALGTLLIGIVFVAVFLVNRFLGVALTSLFRSN